MLRPKVIFVEDDELLSLTMKSTLEKNGYEVVLCDDLSRAEYFLEENIIRAVIIEKDLPKDELIAFIIMAQKQIPKTAVIILSSTDNELDLLHTGADDWLRKPFEMSILLARLAVLCR